MRSNKKIVTELSSREDVLLDKLIEQHRWLYYRKKLGVTS